MGKERKESHFLNPASLSLGQAAQGQLHGATDHVTNGAKVTQPVRCETGSGRVPEWPLRNLGTGFRRA